MKKIYRYFAMAALAVMSLAVASCDEYKSVADNGVWHMWKITVQGEGVQGDKVTLALGETLQLDLTIVPSHVNVVDPVWTSSDESVVTVSETGLLTAVKSGEAIIHVYSEYNPEIYDDLTVKVSGGAVGISKKLVDQKDAD